MDYPHSELTHQIIGAAMVVHSALGPGFIEKIYENAMVRQLGRAGLAVRQQVQYPVQFDGFLVGEHVLDLVVAEKVYVELKCKDVSDLEKAQVLSGLKASNLAVGLLINFRMVHLKNGIHRIARTDDLWDLRKRNGV